MLQQPPDPSPHSVPGPIPTSLQHPHLFAICTHSHAACRILNPGRCVAEFVAFPQLTEILLRIERGLCLGLCSVQVSCRSCFQRCCRLGTINERLKCCTGYLQSVPNNYETDLILPIMDAAAKIAGTSYAAADEAGKTALKVIGDHARAAVYLISDGVLPSNVGRGYIVRRLIRRLVMKVRCLHIHLFAIRHMS